MNKQKIKLIGTAISLLLASNYSYAAAVTLDVTAWKGNEAEPAGFPVLLKKFEQENPDIKIKLSFISRGDTDVVIPPRLQGNNSPDVMMVDMPLVKIWGDAGMLKDLNTKSDWYGDIAPAIKESIAPKGKLYVQPLELVGMGNFINTDLMKKAGIDKTPTTVNELIDSCKKLNDAGISPMLFPSGLSARLFAFANGLSRSPSKPWELGNGTASFVDDPGFNKAFSLTRDLIAANCFDPKIQAALDPWTTTLSEFRGGRVAMVMHGAWNIKSFSETEGLNYTLGPIPTDKATGTALDTFGMGWAISSKTKHAEAARKFLNFFAEDENLAVLLKDESAYSPYIKGTDGVPALAEKYNAARAAGNIVMWPVYMNHWPQAMESESVDGMASFLLDPDMSSKEVLEIWDETVEDSM
ncbi:ABC transporter substrate-binding protein [Psychromonas sp. SA13A]|uniref:ABC transporter substrate-binding protein n=1 Tax=Psychromonas sp. SA13A TaxID=2686346 RepID=UPI0014094373|nr:ABC transporter substrate-binding protein [Psychromonas sp. SA13A]